jgi:predicted house-cleaning noncanonical NTP pyrophosphatase (MazG superfamily)
MSYNKLVRDKIIDIIKLNGEKPVYHTLNNEEYIEELLKKLIEEANEFIEADSPEELADLMEVVYSIAKTKNIDLEEVEQIRIKKREKRGGFDNKIYLEGVENELEK